MTDTHGQHDQGETPTYAWEVEDQHAAEVAELRRQLDAANAGWRAESARLRTRIAEECAAGKRIINSLLDAVSAGAEAAPRDEQDQGERRDRQIQAARDVMGWGEQPDAWNEGKVAELAAELVDAVNAAGGLLAPQDASDGPGVTRPTPDAISAASDQRQPLTRGAETDDERPEAVGPARAPQTGADGATHTEGYDGGRKGGSGT